MFITTATKAHRITERNKKRLLTKLLRKIRFSIHFSTSEGKNYTKWYFEDDEETSFIPEIKKILEKHGYIIEVDYKQLHPSISISW